MNRTPHVVENFAPAAAPVLGEEGFGCLQTEKGCLPLTALAVRARVCGLTARVRVEQTYCNTLGEPIEATYLFPLPDRAAVSKFELCVGDRLIAGELQERAQARREYDAALAAGRRAGIAEENRPDVFSLRVGNLPPGEQIVARIELTQPLPYADGEAEFRFPLVVAPRYIPGAALPRPPVGPGTAWDTDAVPDASLISPPVLLPGFPNPVRLQLEVDLDPAGLTLGKLRSSLHAVTELPDPAGIVHVRVQPGERLNRDFILRWQLGEGSLATSCTLTPDSVSENAAAENAPAETGTFQLTVLPPLSAAPPRPRDVVLVLDRSGSMGGWKMLAARRAAARLIDTLTPRDRCLVLAFDDEVEAPPGQEQLVAATDRNRFRAVEFLAGVDARGGTELLAPLTRAAQVLHEQDDQRERVLLLITDGQVGNEDQLVQLAGNSLAGTRIFAIGIDQGVNAGFLQRLAVVGGGRCELIESEDRLDEVMSHVQRRIGQPILAQVSLTARGLTIVPDSLTPHARLEVYPGVPLIAWGRYERSASDSAAPARMVLKGKLAGDAPWSAELAAATVAESGAPQCWARGRVRQLEDAFVTQPYSPELERQIIATSLKFGVLCRFTAFVAVDKAEVVNASGEVRSLVQPVEMPAGWEAAARGGKRKALSAYGVARTRSAARSAMRLGAPPPAFGTGTSAPLPQSPQLPCASAPAPEGAAAYGGNNSDADDDVLSDSLLCEFDASEPTGAGDSGLCLGAPLASSKTFPPSTTPPSAESAGRVAVPAAYAVRAADLLARWNANEPSPTGLHWHPLRSAAAELLELLGDLASVGLASGRGKLQAEVEKLLAWDSAAAPDLAELLAAWRAIREGLAALAGGQPPADVAAPADAGNASHRSFWNFWR